MHTYTLTFFHKPAVDGNTTCMIQHICLENSICENVAFCAQSCCFLLCFALPCTMISFLQFCSNILFHFYMLSKNLGLQFLDGWRGQNKL